MLDYEVALIVCLMIPLVPVVLFYILRPWIRQKVIQRVLRDSRLSFPPVMWGFVFGELVAVVFTGVGFFSVWDDNFDCGLVKKSVIVFESVPPAGHLLINGRYRGRTTVAVSLKRGRKYQVKIESVPGYLSAESIIEVGRGDNAASEIYRINLKRAPIGRITLTLPFSVRGGSSEAAPLITTRGGQGKVMCDLLTIKEGWVEVRLEDGTEGWVRKPRDTTKTRSPEIPNPSSSVREAVRYVTIVTPMAKVRSEPSLLDGKVIATVSQNAKFSVIAYKEGWYKVALPDGREGWIYERFVKE